MCVTLCVCVCVEREKERVRERERELYPFPILPTPKYICQYSKLSVYVFSDLWSDYLACFVLLFFSDAPPINQDKKSVKGQFFYHLSFILRTVCELTFSIKQMHYKTGTLWHSDASILLTSVNVVLDKRHSDAFILFTSAKSHLLASAKEKSCSGLNTVQNFFKSSAPCVLLSLMPTCHFLNGWCLVGACFLDLLHSSFSSSVPCCRLLPTALFTNPPYVKMANFRYASNAKSMFIGLTNCFWPIGTGRILPSRK